MHILSINRARAEPIEHAKASGRTGIYKRPVASLVNIKKQGLGGDTIVDTDHHGGVDQAIYVYGAPDYAWWKEKYDLDLAPGTFGENITITDFESAQAVIGDRFHFGKVILEITSPRIPCVTLMRRMNDRTFLKKFRAAERPGVYCRVIQEGSIQSGDAAQYTPYDGVGISVIALFRDFFDPCLDEITIRRHLAAPIAIRSRREKELQLARLLGQ